MAELTDFIRRELDKVKTKYKEIDGVELISCVPALVQLKIVWVHQAMFTLQLPQVHVYDGCLDSGGAVDVWLQVSVPTCNVQLRSPFIFMHCYLLFLFSQILDGPFAIPLRICESTTGYTFTPSVGSLTSSGIDTR